MRGLVRRGGWQKTVTIDSNMGWLAGWCRKRVRVYVLLLVLFFLVGSCFSFVFILLYAIF
jgi:hypothetical protein